MLIVDEAGAKRLAQGTKREKAAAELTRWVAEQTANNVYVRDHEISPANSERQLGQRFWPHEFEARLKKLNPSLFFEVNSFNPTKKAIFQTRGGEKVFLCAYENSVMPERSIIKVKEELVRDFDAMPAMGGKLHRNDLPKSELVNGELKFDGPPAGFKKVLVPWGELTRGWRTALLKLVTAQVTTPTEVERVFGADDTAAWATHTGKQRHELPW